MSHQPFSAIPAGCWALRDGQALSLQPHQPGRLRVVQGRVWVTVTQRQHATHDHVLRAGDSIAVPPRSHVVMESWDTTEPVAFEWDRVVATGRVRTDWDAAVRTPSHDLARALVVATAEAGHAAQALVRLLLGLGRWVAMGIRHTVADGIYRYKNNSF